MATLPPRATVVIAGAGIAGLGLAFELARRHVDVLVLERDHVGAGAAGVAAGMLGPAAEAEHLDGPLFVLCQESLRRYPEWVQAIEQASGLACGLRREGTLLAALSRDDEDEIARLVRFQERYGVAGEWLSAEQALEREPHLSPRVTGALFLPNDWQVDPQATLVALERAVTALGGRVVTGASVTGFETATGRIQSVTGTLDGAPFTVTCETAVMALGAWSSRDVAWPAEPLGIRPVKGQLLHLRGPELIRYVVRTPHVYLVPRAGGQLVVGATMEEQGFDAAPTAGAVMDLLWNARLALPGVYDLALADVRVGFRPATRDHLPRIGETSVPGLYAATGHFRHGVLLAPATAMLLADTLTGGGVSPLLEPFALAPAEAVAPEAPPAAE